MDTLFSNFSIIPSRLITHYLVSDDISKVCLKVEAHISVAQREIFEKLEQVVYNPTGAFEKLEPLDSVKIKSLRQKIKSFVGMRELVMDQALIDAELSV
ncbi:MAG: hypothetical protein PHG66_00875 [Candidatus Colwellbacteria bacterium]|nr:hypothetical protein [Candidatus Colwellbacteria bacterium]